MQLLDLTLPVGSQWGVVNLVAYYVSFKGDIQDTCSGVCLRDCHQQLVMDVVNCQHR